MKERIIRVAGLAGVLGLHSLYAQVPLPTAEQTKPVILLHGTAHLGNGEVLERAAIAFERGIITRVEAAEGLRIDFSSYEVIDIEGKHVYPGLVLPVSNAGLEEISAVRPTRDFYEVGLFNPHVRALIAYNTDSEVLATLRFNGILLAQTTPQGGVLSGLSSIMMLDGWNWEDAVHTPDDGIHMRWPSARDKEAYKKTCAQIRRFFEDARAYVHAEKPVEVNLKFEAMRGLFAGERKLYIHASRYDEILESLQFAFSERVHDVVLVGAQDAGYVLDFLKDHKVSVLLSDVHRLPSRSDEDVDAPYRLAKELHEKGILVGLSYTSELQSSRNLPFFAGTVAAYGLDKEEALKMITSNTARILGIDKAVGTLEVGKEAHIVVSEGDLLDMRTSQLSHAFVKGKRIDLQGRQQRLYERFMKKYGKN